MQSLIGLVHEFTYRTSVAEPRDVGDGPYGTRQYFEMTEGVVEGIRLSGLTVGTGSDWMLAGSDGFFRMDARIQIMTHDGAVICVRYGGPAEANAKLSEALAANKPTDFNDSGYGRTGH